MTLIRREPMLAYHQNAAVSNSKLKYLRERGPLGYKHKYIDRIVEDEDTDALRLGKAFDILVCEGMSGFNREFIVKPTEYVNEKNETKPWNGNANVCKAWLAEAEAKKLIPVSVGEMAMFNAMSNSVFTHPIASELLSTCEFQVTVRTRLKNGLDLQARPDGLSLKSNKHSRGMKYTVDLKTTQDWTDWFDEFDPEDPRSAAAIWKHGYHRQGAIDNCLLILEKDVGPTVHFLIVVEKQDPFRCGVVELTDQYLEIGWRQVEFDLNLLAHCMKHNLWPGSPQQVITVAPPAWLMDKDAMAPVAARAVSA